jgi:transcription elongation factor GreA
MTDTTLTDAAQAYLATVKDTHRQAAIAEVNRFVKWYGGDKPVAQIRGHDVAQYAEAMGPSSPETSRRAAQVREFIAYLHKSGLSDTKLASHFRLKKSGNKTGTGVTANKPVETVELTQQGVDDLKKELEGLMEDRIAVRKDIQLAMQDKDFRENSPLDAAKDKQGHIEARIREIEAMLKRAVIVDGSAHQGRVKVGTHVSVRDLEKGKVNRWSIVGPTEANAKDGKISSVSPVGKALLDARVGEEVEIAVPSGKLRLKIEDIEG